jgi:hypothetical protein
VLSIFIGLNSYHIPVISLVYNTKYDGRASLALLPSIEDSMSSMFCMPNFRRPIPLEGETFEAVRLEPPHVFHLDMC